MVQQCLNFQLPHRNVTQNTLFEKITLVYLMGFTGNRMWQGCLCFPDRQNREHWTVLWWWTEYYIDTYLNKPGSQNNPSINDTQISQYNLSSLAGII